MSDLIEQLERAVDLYLCGRPADAVEIGEALLTRSRGTPHAATVHRHQAEFLHSMGDYETARHLAQEAGNLARATRHPGEILAATLTVLACDLYSGRVAAVHQQIAELMELAPSQPMPMAFMGKLMLLVGNFGQAIQLCEQARGLLEAEAVAHGHPVLELLQANLLLVESRAELCRDVPRNAVSRLERALEMELISQVPTTLARAMLGVALLRCGEEDLGRELIAQATAIGRKVSADLHGHCLAMAGLASAQFSQHALAADQLRLATGLMNHSLEKQQSHYLLGVIARRNCEERQAEQAFRRATDPSTETHFGRLAVQALHGLVGLRPV